MPVLIDQLTDSAPTTIILSAEAASARRFQLIASKIEADHDLLAIASDNISRWLARGHTSGGRLEGWLQKIRAAQESESGMAELLALLRDESPEARQWKAFSPFPGILTEEELESLSWTSNPPTLRPQS